MASAGEAGDEAILVLLRKLGERGAGIGTIYDALELLADRYRLDDAVLVGESELTGPQLYRLDHRSIGAERAGRLLAKGPGLHTEPDVVPTLLHDALLALVPAALALQVADAPAASASGAPRLASGFDDALAVAAANGSRYGWVSTVVVLSIGDSMHSDEQISELIDAAFAQVLRTGDVAGPLGARRFGALLANARTEEAGAFLARIRDALGDGGEGLPISVGAACAPEDSVDPIQLLTLAHERAGQR